MLLRMNEQLRINNLRNYPTEIVDQLRELLTSGVAACPDPHRENFYDVGNADRIFFIYTSPISDRVMLLATWLRILSLPNLISPFSAPLNSRTTNV
jgi:hypothetical protein